MTDKETIEKAIGPLRQAVAVAKASADNENYCIMFTIADAEELIRSLPKAIETSTVPYPAGTLLTENHTLKHRIKQLEAALQDRQLQYERLDALYKKIRETLEAKQAVLDKIENWCKAYPLEAFPEPDLKKAAKVLKAAGMTLDCISASNARHVLRGIQKHIDEAKGA